MNDVVKKLSHHSKVELEDIYAIKVSSRDKNLY